MKTFQQTLAAILSILLLLPAILIPVSAEDAALSVDLSTISGTEGNSGEGIDKLFDNDSSSKYCTMNDTAQIVFALLESAVVRSYSLISADQAARDPKAWTLSGSDDGENWTVLDSRNDVNFPLRGYTADFEIENDRSYLWYKFDVTENHGTDPWGYSILALAELSLYAGAHQEEETDEIAVDPFSISGSTGNGSNTVENLFDQNPSTKYLVMRSAEDEAVTVEFSLKKAAEINTYRLTSANDWDVRDPKAWTVYASRDGSTWTQIDSRENEDLPARNTAYSYCLEESNVDSYVWFRFVFTQNNGVDPFGYDCIQLADLEVLITSGEEEDETIVVDLSTLNATTPNSASQGPECLFDKNTGTKYLVSGKSAAVSFALKKARVVNGYTLTCTSDWASRYPSQWTLYASNDGEAWTKLDERSGETATGLQKSATYVFPNTEKYLYYKFDMTKNGGNAYTGLAELELLKTEEAPFITREVAIRTSTAEGTAPNSSSQSLANLFDKNKETKYLTHSSTASVVFETEKPAVINRYVLSAANDHTERTPKNFAFYGSLDKETWVELDRRENFTIDSKDYFCGAAFAFENNVVYKAYKLEIEGVSSGDYMGLSHMSVFTQSPEEGLDVSVPACVDDLTGLPGIAILRSVTLKALSVDAAGAAAIASAAPVTVYGHETENGTGLGESFAPYSGVRFVNLLDVAFTKQEENSLTAVGTIRTASPEYTSLKMRVTFSSGGETVKSFTRSFNSVYTTVTGYASTDEATAQAQQIETVDGVYVFALKVKGIPGGEYDAAVDVFATIADENGETQTVVSSGYTGTISV